ncbi:MAG: hypothetical protein WAL02_13730 [Rhodoplanes sp.]
MPQGTRRGRGLATRHHHNLAAAVGTALVGALVVGLLSITNDRLLSVMERTTATPEQVAETVISSA